MKQILILIVLSISLCIAQKKPVVSQNTLVSRKELIQNIKSQIENIQRQGNEAIQNLNGRLQMLEAMTQDSIKVKK